jgi:hypothetical protein
MIGVRHARGGAAVAALAILLGCGGGGGPSLSPYDPHCTLAQGQKVGTDAKGHVTFDTQVSVPIVLIAQGYNLVLCLQDDLPTAPPAAEAGPTRYPAH